MRAMQKNGGRGPVKVDPVAVAGLVLAIPGALVAVADLVERLKKKRSLDRLIENAKKQRLNHPQINIFIITPRGVALPLEDADSAKLLDAARDSAKKDE